MFALQLGALQAAISEVRSPLCDWQHVPSGLYWELAVATAVFSVSAAHLWCAMQQKWPAPTKTMRSIQQKLANAQAMYQAGRYNEMNQNDLPEGVPTLYLLYGAAGYALVCGLFAPTRVVYAISSMAVGILAAHYG